MVKNIIIVDDSEFKRETIKEYMSGILPKATISEYTCTHDGFEAVRKVKSEIISHPNEWLVISDMVMPYWKGGHLSKDGGVSMLTNMDLLDLTCPAIISSFEKVDDDEMRAVYENYIGSVIEKPTVYCKPFYEALLAKIGGAR